MTEGPCGTCGHLFGKHQVIAWPGGPIDGGFILCPFCICFMTWSANGELAPDVHADDDIVTQSRAVLHLTGQLTSEDLDVLAAHNRDAWRLEMIRRDKGR